MLYFSFKNLMETLENPENELQMRTFTEPAKFSAIENKIRVDTNDNIQLPKLLQQSNHLPVVNNSSSLLNSDSTHLSHLHAKNTVVNSNNEFKEPITLNGIPIVRSGKHINSRHYFHQISAVSFVSISNIRGTYSEISFYLWFAPKEHKQYQDRYRGVCNLMYDAEDDLWSVSAKIFKRPSYYVKEDVEMQLENRSCFTTELKTEIKRMLLLLNISPKEIYRLLRRASQKDFNIVHLDFGFTTIESSNHNLYIKEYEKTINPSFNHNIYERSHGQDRYYHG